MEKSSKKMLILAAACMMLLNAFAWTAFAASANDLSGSAPAGGPTLVAVSSDIVADFVKSEAPAAGGSGSWALMDLILAGVTVLAALSLLSRCSDARVKLLAILMAATAIATFLLTQDLSKGIVLVDKWTVLMAAYAIGCAALTERKAA